MAESSWFNCAFIVWFYFFIIAVLYNLFLPVFNLCNHVDVDGTKRQIEQYKKENREQIRKNLSKMVRPFFFCIRTEPVQTGDKVHTRITESCFYRFIDL